MGNSNGNYETTLKNFFRAFDSLPPECRKSLRECDYNFVPQPMMTLLKRGISTERLIELLLDGNASHIGAEAYRLYGEDHPQAVKPMRIKRK